MYVCEYVCVSVYACIGVFVCACLPVYLLFIVIHFGLVISMYVLM